MPQASVEEASRRKLGGEPNVRPRSLVKSSPLAVTLGSSGAAVVVADKFDTRPALPGTQVDLVA